MKDIPLFTSEYGVASLILKEIPARQNAYVIVRDSREPQKLVQDCVSFCRACGALRIYATGHEKLADYSFYTGIWEMRCSRDCLDDTDAALWPVQQKTLEQWRNLYNQKAERIPNAAWMTMLDADKMLNKGDGYFIHRSGELLGIGRASGKNLDWVAAVRPGAGRDVVLALNHAMIGETVVLTVASENRKAISLYESLGFFKTREISDWYQIF